MNGDKMSELLEIGTEKEESNGNSALDWEIFDVLCRDDLGLNVSFFIQSNLLINKKWN